MKRRRTSTLGFFLCLFFLSTTVLSTGCDAPKQETTQGKRTIIATYSVLGSVIKELVGNEFIVTSAIPNGLDPHEWEPSAKDIESLMNADLIVENGLHLEGGMEKTLEAARMANVRFFTASDHIDVRRVGEGEGIPSDDPDQQVGAEDPHLWMDPIAIKAVAEALATELAKDFGVNLDSRLKDFVSRLDALDTSVRKTVETLAVARRVLVTGHESLGYFAQRYGFKLVGAIIPNLSTQAEASASDMADLVKLIKDNKVGVIFTELGTSARVAESLARETGTKAVELVTHQIPNDGSYITFINNLVSTIMGNL